MKEFSANLLFILIDICIIFISLVLAYTTRNLLANTFGGFDSYLMQNYLSLYPLYIIIITLLVYEGIYTHRYDFWHESRIIGKSLAFSFFIILAYLAMTKSVQNYSRAVIVFSFVFMIFLLPLAKNISKKLLYHFGIWQKRAKIYGEDSFLTDEIYGNPYLGYVKPKDDEEPSTIFVNSKDHDIITLKSIISNEIKTKQEVIFIPLMDDYDLTHSHIYDLSNTRTNLIVFQNRLKSKYRVMVKNISDLTLSLILLPLLIPVMLYIAYQIKRENPNEKILFKQKRLGKNGKTFSCYKFQTMHENSDTTLQEYLNLHPEESAYYETYHKYKNDPRITRVGHWLRRSSLDELPQLFNVFRGDMSFIGPRPYMLNEEQKIGNSLDIVLTVKPGITGLWQVNGRSDVDFYSRVEMDVWYIRNWNLWMDLVILVKTVKTVLFKDGAS